MNIYRASGFVGIQNSALAEGVGLLQKYFAGGTLDRKTFAGRGVGDN
jgi:hypothetical protein